MIRQKFSQPFQEIASYTEGGECNEKRRQLRRRRLSILLICYGLGHSQHPGGYNRQWSWYNTTRLFTN